tara:strand:- start:40071 stop:40679 length:609 start_codon:yes stop_codon:yes gene_type:complete
MLEDNIYKEIYVLYNAKSKLLAEKLDKKSEKDCLKVIEYIEKICKTLSQNTHQKTITVRLIPELIKIIDKTCTKKIFRGGGEVGAPFYSMANGDGMNRISDVPEINYSQVDFENGIARQAVTISGGGDTVRCPKEVMQGLGGCFSGGGKILLMQLISKMIVKKLTNKKIEKNAKRMISSFIYHKILCNVNKSVSEKKLLKFM